MEIVWLWDGLSVSETHHLHAVPDLMGFAALNLSYGRNQTARCFSQPVISPTSLFASGNKRPIVRNAWNWPG